MPATAMKALARVLVHASGVITFLLVSAVAACSSSGSGRTLDAQAIPSSFLDKWDRVESGCAIADEDTEIDDVQAIDVAESHFSFQQPIALLVRILEPSMIRVSGNESQNETSDLSDFPVYLVYDDTLAESDTVGVVVDAESGDYLTLVVVNKGILAGIRPC